MMYPFARKQHTDGSKVTRRTRGFQLNLDSSGTPQSSSFAVPYVRCLITATEIVGARFGDRFKFEVLDTVAGTVSGVPNANLNTFGEDVYAAKDFYRAASAYDAELFGGLQIRVTCTPADSEARTIGINLELHELTS